MSMKFVYATHDLFEDFLRSLWSSHDVTSCRTFP